ncbi:uncharacterized protein [Gossypium hirsutum]|uniref:Uncharacterized protein n=1 Tax=Gossypium hirsutum TaxID=3635 RepID=A0A1U8K0P2_GOSHI|nr:uncharacterized protein LOC107911170 [Gossypium hirsutum]
MIAEIKGLSPLTCMHKIQVVENAIPKREAQRRFNSLMMEVARKEVQKLLDAGMIYPISNSDWVSPVQVVLKKIGETIIENLAGDFQIPVAPEDREKIMFMCPFGTFTYRQILFGICNAPTTFQRSMKDNEFEFDQSCRDAFDMFKYPYSTKVSELSILMTSDRVTTRMQKELGHIQGELSHMQLEFSQLDGRIDIRLKDL